MTDLMAARVQMGFSLGFHMIFAAFGVGMPLLMLLAEGIGIVRRRPHYLALAKGWAKLTAAFFAIGAVSGTALSFELGLLWPAFMQRFGPVIGPAFTAEAFAFFLEAIFLALYVYGWDRLRPWAHWFTGWGVAVFSAASSVLVSSANAWMQNPVGAEAWLRSDGAVASPARLLFGNPTWPVMAIHSTLATYAATAFAMAGAYAWWARKHAAAGTLDGVRRERIHAALVVTLAVGAVVAALMPITGDASARLVARQQPVKLAAMESQFRTEAGAPLRIGGWPDVEGRQVIGAVEIPHALSWLAYRDPTAPVQGLDETPADRWPNVPVTHLSFQAMVGAGIAMLAVAAWFWWTYARRRGQIWSPLPRWLLGALAVSSPLGLVALEAGWVVAEVGRQPWIVYGVMRTGEAVTPAAGIQATLMAFLGLYLLLGGALMWLMRRLNWTGLASPGSEEPAARAHDRPVTAKEAWV
ncbi:cytochrome ubiquinol oxidase subunit I [Carboxydochorda subterranea]|uniref:Cytochrome ubiquinol oxidase subunit I n=1 Tax=Carboxydichorda subterranea TaxID=3109565 RepID=A0ABZ1BXI3_9FIRM|nr:cytochrome ubiquinol oxidase subunit I [Limnochorda sp. L945t]WRP17251.1 cytochrome ubiquinol oxidase subunit I [Limnochorda sp. L945t]